jgi:hypothetical protein
MHIALVLPLVRTGNQICSDGIVVNVIPFLAQAFIVSEQMVEKLLLPNWFNRKSGGYSLTGPLFPSLHELAKRFGFSIG